MKSYYCSYNPMKCSKSNTKNLATKGCNSRSSSISPDSHLNAKRFHRRCTSLRLATSVTNSSSSSPVQAHHALSASIFHACCVFEVHNLALRTGHRHFRTHSLAATAITAIPQHLRIHWRASRIGTAARVAQDQSESKHTAEASCSEKIGKSSEPINAARMQCARDSAQHQNTNIAARQSTHWPY